MSDLRRETVPGTERGRLPSGDQRERPFRYSIDGFYYPAAGEAWAGLWDR